jgi:predicted peroxiredoxin/TusA-related sulfurtransferase
MIVSILVLVLSVLISTGSCATQKQNMEVTPMGTMVAHDSIDLRGKTITTYILYFTVEKLQHMHQGEVLEVITDNYEAIHTDIQAWTRMTGHILKSTEKKEHYYIFYIEKSSPTEVDSQLAMVISSKGLTELLSPLGFALGAALEGIDVHLYFQGPGVKVLKQGYQAKLPGLGRPFSNTARKGMANSGHIPPQEKLQQLHELGAHIYICAGSMDHYKVKKEELIFDDIIVAEYLTFMEVMHSADIQLYM